VIFHNDLTHDKKIRRISTNSRNKGWQKVVKKSFRLLRFLQNLKSGKVQNLDFLGFKIFTILFLGKL